MTFSFARGCAVAGALLIALSSCSSAARALRNVGCDETAAPLVTDFIMNKWGIGSFACLRLRTVSSAEHHTLAGACKLARAPRAQTLYTETDIPVPAPAFWDLREGERVERALLYGPGQHWRGILFTKRSAGAEIWLMCAGGL